VKRKEGLELRFWELAASNAVAHVGPSVVPARILRSCWVKVQTHGELCSRDNHMKISTSRGTFSQIPAHLEFHYHVSSSSSSFSSLANLPPTALQVHCLPVVMQNACVS
jgi:hypothetical protein